MDLCLFLSIGCGNTVVERFIIPYVLLPEVKITRNHVVFKNSLSMVREYFFIQYLYMPQSDHLGENIYKIVAR
eukprot:TRINITY_DN2306_c0_g1_i2.p4 TRINITY_DN2306_c0_g1~~TRINITY_DN2306_c0_g1_i2.p4  ORF type:complete len:73 (-),score=2.88 TRINITY_DN2306_c0_g1_i2:499-717(-)